MLSNEDFPDVRGDAATVLEWLRGHADWVAAFYPSEARDDERVFRHVLLIALNHESSEIRGEALEVLQCSLEKHDTAHLFARPIAENLARFQGEELLTALSIIGLSCDPSLAGYLIPFLANDDPHVRSAALESTFDLEAIRRNTQP